MSSTSHGDQPISQPRQLARTRRFTLGVPSAYTISPDGGSVLFLRSRSGDDPFACLWALDLDSGAERLLVDPVALLADAGEPPAGIAAYATDDMAALAAFSLSGDLWVVDVTTGESRLLN